MTGHCTEANAGDGLGFGRRAVARRVGLSSQLNRKELARRSGFDGVVDLLKVAKPGLGENVYLVEFVYHASAFD